MNAILDSTLKTLACGAAAAAITAVMALSFVESTQTAPGALHAPHRSTVSLAKVSVHPKHTLFGQSLPAVLVD